MSKAIYPGSFDPVTFGHLDIIKRSAEMFDEVIVGVLIDYMKANDISVIVRGLRAITDFDYELQIAQSNRKVSNETIDTVFLTTSIDYAYLSSSIVREYASYGTDVTDFVPEFVARRLKDRFQSDK